MLLNASEHPACTLDTEWYRRVRAPRPIYDELVDHRGWLHRVASTPGAEQPCTSVPAALACRALNVALGLAPAAIALFANSPLQAGRETGLKENRLTMWDRMFRHALRRRSLPAAAAAPAVRGPGRPFPLDVRPATPRAAGRALAGLQARRAALSARRALPGLLSRGAALVRPRRRDRPGIIAGSPGRAFRLFAVRPFPGRALALPARRAARPARAARDGTCSSAWARRAIEGRAPGAVFPDRQLADEAGADVARSAGALGAAAGPAATWPRPKR